MRLNVLISYIFVYTTHADIFSTSAIRPPRNFHRLLLSMHSNNKHERQPKHILAWRVRKQRKFPERKCGCHTVLPPFLFLPLNRVKVAPTMLRAIAQLPVARVIDRELLCWPRANTWNFPDMTVTVSLLFCMHAFAFPSLVFCTNINAQQTEAGY